MLDSVHCLGRIHAYESALVNVGVDVVVHVDVDVVGFFIVKQNKFTLRIPLHRTCHIVNNGAGA